jgi:hypothetical protein
MMLRTVAEIADVLNVDEKDARSLVTFLVGVGLAKFRGERPVTRGRGPNVYEVEPGAAADVRKMVAELE